MFIIHEFSTNMIKIPYILPAVFLLLSCSLFCNKTNENSIEEVAIKKYKDNIHYLSNKNKTFTICYRKEAETALKPYPPLKFFVFDETKKEIIFEDNLANGSIEWISMYQFQVKIIPGIVSIESDKMPGYVFDVKEKKKQ